MASLKVKQNNPPTGNFKSEVVIQGTACYYVGPLDVEQVEQPKFAALYVYNFQLQDAALIHNLYLPSGIPGKVRRTCEELLIDLQNTIHQHNVYVRDVKQICQISDDDLEHASFVISEKLRPADAGARTYTSHNLSEVSVMMTEAVGNRNAVVSKGRGGIQKFKDTNRAADQLHFVLLHSRGTDGWSPDQICELDEYHGNWDDFEAKRLTCNKYYKYKLMQRRGETNYFHLSGRLFQEYVCINYVKQSSKGSTM